LNEFSALKEGQLSRNEVNREKIGSKMCEMLGRRGVEQFKYSVSNCLSEIGLVLSSPVLPLVTSTGSSRNKGYDFAYEISIL